MPRREEISPCAAQASLLFPRPLFAGPDTFTGGLLLLSCAYLKAAHSLSSIMTTTTATENTTTTTASENSTIATPVESSVLPASDSQTAETNDMQAPDAQEPCTLRATAEEVLRRLDKTSPLAIALSHGLHVSDLALELYDALVSLHDLPAIWRKRLAQAAILHDLGQIFGMKGHHKNTLLLLLEEKAVQDEKIAAQVHELVSALPEGEHLVVGLIARYHRRAWPSTRNALFASLALQDRLGVSVCASLLRIADALDVAHTGEVRELRVVLDKSGVVLELHGANGPCASLEEHALRARAKGELFMDLFAREVTWRLC